jgi:hypothetical protein
LRCPHLMRHNLINLLDEAFIHWESSRTFSSSN